MRINSKLSVKKYSASIKRIRFKAYVFGIALISIISLRTFHSFALTGAGTLTDPIIEEFSCGFRFMPHLYLKNLSSKDGTIIKLKSIYEPNTYELSLRAGEGHFSDGSDLIIKKVKYGEKIEEEDPILDGSTFLGWYIKGNKDENEENSPIVMSEDSYRIATDYREDAILMDCDDDGRAIAKAIFRENPMEGEGRFDNDNIVVEFDGENLTKEGYEKAHGAVTHPYSNLILNATTSLAKSYTWFVQKNGEGEYIKLPENKGKICLKELTRSDAGNKYKCEVLVAGDEPLTYETKVQIASLIESRAPKIKVLY